MRPSLRKEQVSVDISNSNILDDVLCTLGMGKFAKLVSIICHSIFYYGSNKSFVE